MFDDREMKKMMKKHTRTRDPKEVLRTWANERLNLTHDTSRFIKKIGNTYIIIGG